MSENQTITPENLAAQQAALAQQIDTANGSVPSTFTGRSGHVEEAADVDRLIESRTKAEALQGYYQHGTDGFTLDEAKVSELEALGFDRNSLLGMIASDGTLPGRHESNFFIHDAVMASEEGGQTLREMVEAGRRDRGHTSEEDVIEAGIRQFEEAEAKAVEDVEARSRQDEARAEGMAEIEALIAKYKNDTANFDSGSLSRLYQARHQWQTLGSCQLACDSILLEVRELGKAAERRLAIAASEAKAKADAKYGKFVPKVGQ